MTNVAEPQQTELPPAPRAPGAPSIVPTPPSATATLDRREDAHPALAPPPPAHRPRLRALMNRSPSALFVLPGTTALAAGLLACSFVLARIEVLGREWDVHALIAGALVAIVGSQLVSLGVCTQAYACYFVGAESAWFERARRHLSLEHGLLLGATLTLAGSLTLGGIGLAWIGSGFGALGGERLAICAASVVVIGVQTIFYSFMLSVLGLRREQ